MNVLEQIAQLSQVLPPEKQAEVLDFIEFLVSRQPHTPWAVERGEGVIGTVDSAEAPERPWTERGGRIERRRTHAY